MIQFDKFIGSNLLFAYISYLSVCLMVCAGQMVVVYLHKQDVVIPPQYSLKATVLYKIE
jgi:hypothetical protein